MNRASIAASAFPEPAPAESTWRRSGVVSLLVHAIFATLLLTLAAPPRFEVVPEPAIEIEVVPPAAPREEIRPQPTPAPVARPPEATPAAIAPPQPQPQPTAPAAVPPRPVETPREAPSSPREDDMIRPTHMLSAASLADPRSRKGREMLANLALDDRIEQLCGLEAMAQIHAWKKVLEPDRVVAYAMGDTELDGQVLSARGAAVHAGGRWYRLTFVCALAPGFDRVLTFAYRVGEPIPKSEWASHALVEDEGPED